MSDQQDLHWTLKGPALIVGILLMVLGAVTTAKGRAWLGVAIIALGLAFTAYSFTIKDWCELRQTGWGGGGWNQMAFGGSLGECLKQKGWLSF